MRYVLTLVIFSALASRGSCKPLPGCSDVLQNVLTIKESVERFMAASSKNVQLALIGQKRKIQMMIGLDVDDEAALEAMVCQMIEVNTVEELLDVINLPIPLRTEFQTTYDAFVAYIQSDGFIVMTQRYLFQQVDASLFIDDTGFPDFPLGISYDEALDALSAIPEHSVRELFQLVDGNIDQLAESLEVAESLEEFAELTNSTEHMTSFYAGIRETTEATIDMLIAVGTLVDQAKELGLLDLGTDENDV